MAIYVQDISAAEELNHLKQIQLVVRAGLEVRISRFQIPSPSHAAKLPPAAQPPFQLHSCNSVCTLQGG